MQQTNCTTILHAAEVLPVVNVLIASSSGMHCAKIPSFQEMLDSKPPAYAFDKDFTEAPDDPIVILHSSGSTGKYCLSRLNPNV